MNILKSIKRRFSGLDANQQQLLTRYIAATENLDSYSGIPVTVRSGLHLDSVYTAIKRLADAVAMTPIGLFRRKPDGQVGRDQAYDHPLFPVLTRRASRDLTDYTWKHITVSHLAGWGNAFSHIERNNAGQVIGLNPMYPDDVRIEGRNQQGSLVYSWKNNQGSYFYFPAEDVLHIKGVTLDGVVGISPIIQLRQLVGRTVAREEFQSRFYQNGAMIGGVLAVPAGLTDEQMQRARDSFNELYRGPRNSGKLLLVEGTATYSQLGTHPRDAEFIETAKLDTGHIAAVFGVPAQLLNETETVNRSSAEQIFREFLALGLNTIFCNLESQMNVSLLSLPEQSTMYCEFNRESIVQMDFAAKIAGLKDQILSAIITPNEAREMLNLNPMPGADELLAPVNMMPISKLGQVAPPPVPKPPPAPAPRVLGAFQIQKRSRAAKLNLIRSYKPVLRDAFERVGKREQQDISKAAKKQLRDSDGFGSFLDSYYAEDSPFHQYFTRTMSPLVRSMTTGVHGQVQDQLDQDIDPDADKFQQEYLDNLAFRYTQSSRRQLGSLLDDLDDGDDAGDAVDQRLTEWQNGTSADNPTRPEKDSTNEASRYVNAAARMFMAAGGVTKLVWSGGDCPLCQELDGKTVGVEENFVDQGDSVGDMRAESNYMNPPLHQGCDCTIDPA